MSRCNKCLTNIDQTFNSIAPLKRLTCEIIRNTRVLSQPISLQWNRSLNVGNLRHIWERNAQITRPFKYECSTSLQTFILNQQIIKINESLSSIDQKILMTMTCDGHHRSTGQLGPRHAWSWGPSTIVYLLSTRWMNMSLELIVCSGPYQCPAGRVFQ